MKVVLGENHPDTLNTMNNLAVTYGHQGKHSDAEILLKHCLEARGRVLGESHPDTLRTMNKLADTYESIEKLRSYTSVA
jgi:hypothetical protein